MKRVKFLYKILPLLFVGIGLVACDNDIKDIAKVEEKLQLTASKDSIAIDFDNLRDFIITFDWTEARETSDESIISYTTKLDVVGNNFGTATAIINYEEEGVSSRSFTSEQLYSWMVDRWKVVLTKPFMLEFRVVAEWEGGAVFEAPEVRTVRVVVANVKEEVPAPDIVALSGSALDNATVEMEQTLENENKYAALVELKAGELVIPLSLTKELYLNPASGDGALQDGDTVDVVVDTKRIAWNIETVGEYRVVINLEDSKVAIYSPEKALEPKVVTWTRMVPELDENGNVVKDENGAEIKNEETVHTTITDLWMFGGGTGWGWWKGECSVSLADPQILIYQGAAGALSSGDGVKFVVYGESDYRNNAYAFTNPLTEAGLRQNLSLAADKLGDLHGGYDGETRNSYYKLPSGSNFIVLDLRNMTIIASKK